MSEKDLVIGATTEQVQLIADFMAPRLKVGLLSFEEAEFFLAHKDFFAPNMDVIASQIVFSIRSRMRTAQNQDTIVRVVGGIDRSRKPREVIESLDIKRTVTPSLLGATATCAPEVVRLVYRRLPGGMTAQQLLGFMKGYKTDILAHITDYERFKNTEFFDTHKTLSAWDFDEEHCSYLVFRQLDQKPQAVCRRLEMQFDSSFWVCGVPINYADSVPR